MAVAFPFRTSVSGSVTAIDAYVDSRNAATKLLVGLYADNNGHPGARLATASLSSPKAGAWNLASINATDVISGGTYWIAVLGTGGAELPRQVNRLV